MIGCEVATAKSVKSVDGRSYQVVNTNAVQSLRKRMKFASLMVDVFSPMSEKKSFKNQSLDLDKVTQLNQR